MDHESLSEDERNTLDKRRPNSTLRTHRVNADHKNTCHYILFWPLEVTRLRNTRLIRTMARAIRLDVVFLCIDKSIESVYVNRALNYFTSLFTEYLFI